MDPTERDLGDLDAERPLPPALFTRIESALLAEAAAGQATEGVADSTAVLLSGLDEDRPLPAATRAALVEMLVEAPGAQRRPLPNEPGVRTSWNPRRFHARFVAAAAAVLLVLASVAALHNGSPQDDNVASGRVQGTNRAAGEPVPTTTAPSSTPPAPGAAELSSEPAAGQCTGECPAQGGTSAVAGAARAAAPTSSDAAMSGPYIGSVEPSSGPMSGGTTVTVRGSGFTGAQGVLFGASNALSFTVVSDSELRAVSPPSAQPGAVVLSVTFPDGSSSRAGPDDHFSYTAPGG